VSATKAETHIEFQSRRLADRGCLWIVRVSEIVGIPKFIAFLIAGVAKASKMFDSKNHKS
jgi:hypothetical protein